MTAATDIVVVDDDLSIREAIADCLRAHGYHVRVAAHAAALDELLAQQGTDLIVLDWMMPGEDGLSVCRRLQSRGTPILMLSAMASTPDRVIGLEVGADDYLAKPFDPRELLARVRALLRRAQKQADSAQAAVLRFDGWQLQLEHHRLLTPAGSEVTLTTGEFALLRALAERAGRVLSREQLMLFTRGDASESFDRAVDLGISRLRRKLAQAAPGGEALVQTLRGEGYRFSITVSRR
ncbi:response regulator transcription factor [Stenotrophomonas sp. C1657]|uniref:response regulator transcription factor n=1 Tax=Stenotrophomonas sp. C1657 TaxID=3077844 RepID=UPI00293CE337|nr:response regulator transcription factor [Stenotrophomonas sp. C1657]MDV3516314.1 response regulator transcription factor [Stenotrophomonas sp. C1657]